MRLIDADALMENYNLKDATKYGNRDAEQQNHSYSTMMLYEVADMIYDAPTIEAVPVHGEWVNGCCTNCGAYIPTDSNMDYISEEECNYCYSCGADMRKKV